MSHTLLAPPAIFTHWKEAIDRRLLALAREVDLPAALQKAYECALQHGKRLRPLCLLSVIEALGGSWASGLETACCVELFHRTSRIHNDLPCKSRGECRHTKEAIHHIVGSGEALLASNGLITLAFERLAAQEHLSPQIRIHLIRSSAKAAGAEGILGGQALDLIESRELSSNELWEFHRKKTGALFRGAFEMGGILVNESLQTVKQLGKIGEELGIAYQLLGDLHHIEHDLGGPSRIPSYPIEPRLSAVRTLGIALTRAQALQLVEHARENISRYVRHPEILYKLIERGILRHIRPPRAS